VWKFKYTGRPISEGAAQNISLSVYMPAKHDSNKFFRYMPAKHDSNKLDNLYISIFIYNIKRPPSLVSLDLSGSSPSVCPSTPPSIRVLAGFTKNSTIVVYDDELEIIHATRIRNYLHYVKNLLRERPPTVGAANI
jgi:hypothetical protein